MAVNGQMAFPNATTAQESTRKFAQTIRQIELKWGDDLRVDPLTNEFAIVAVSWREIQVDTAGIASLKRDTLLDSQSIVRDRFRKVSTNQTDHCNLAFLISSFCAGPTSPCASAACQSRA
jgi:hypothetical protein